MKRSALCSIQTVLAVVLAAIALPSLAICKPVASSIEGAWFFKGPGFSGIMTIDSPTAQGRYSCSFNITGIGFGADEKCELFKTGNHILIRSRLAGPAPTPTYQPDNFVLDFDGTSLSGKLMSNTQRDVEFDRQ